MVVKIDAEEAQAPAKTFGLNLTDVVISLAALAILFGTILGLRFAKPIHELADAAARIRDGDLSVRAPVTTQDEVGLLARNFNQMAEEMEQQVTLLQEFQNYFDLSLDMLCIAGHDGYFKRVNPAFERILGWSTEELLSQKIPGFRSPRRPGKDRKRDRQIWPRASPRSPLKTGICARTEPKDGWPGRPIPSRNPGSSTPSPETSPSSGRSERTRQPTESST